MGGFIKSLFGSAEPPAAPKPAAPPNEDLGAALMRLTRTYWTPAPDELARLGLQVDALPWPKLLRLHHLACLELIHATGSLKRNALSASLPAGPTTELYLKTAARLMGAGSPYLPRDATVIQRPRGTVQLPPRRGKLRNASASHHGALEVIRLENSHPVALDFIPFSELVSVKVGPQSLFPPANVTSVGGRNEVACLPLLYGPSWFSEEPTDQNGSMTRFMGHHANVESGIGLGHQDFMCDSVMFGLGSVLQIEFE